MGNTMGYAKYQAISLEGDAAYEELYTRLARWTAEATGFFQEGKPAAAEARLDRCIEVLGYMDRAIDLSHSHDIAVAILSLHRFAISTLVKAKSERTIEDLDPLVTLFLSLAEIFAAIRASRSRQPFKYQARPVRPRFEIARGRDLSVEPNPTNSRTRFDSLIAGRGSSRGFGVSIKSRDTIARRPGLPGCRLNQEQRCVNDWKRCPQLGFTANRHAGKGRCEFWSWMPRRRAG